jgi:hypothetical protein
MRWPSLKATSVRRDQNDVGEEGRKVSTLTEVEGIAGFAEVKTIPPIVPPSGSRKSLDGDDLIAHNLPDTTAGRAAAIRVGAHRDTTNGRHSRSPGCGDEDGC